MTTNPGGAPISTTADAVPLYEPSTVSAAALGLFLVCFAITLAIAFSIVYGTYWFFGHQHEAAAPPDTFVDRATGSRVPFRANTEIAVPPEPRLQPTIGTHESLPRTDVISMYARENAAFASHGWRINERTGLPTIPDSIVAAVAAQGGAKPAPPIPLPALPPVTAEGPKFSPTTSDDLWGVPHGAGYETSPTGPGPMPANPADTAPPAPMDGK